MIATLKANGHHPKERGGNGKITKQQDALSRALGLQTEFAIPTGSLFGSPKCYKVDIAYPEMRIAIEVDGHSHTLASRKEEDQKKEKVLGALGWRVIRFWNSEIDKDLEGCINKARTFFGELA